MMTDTTQIENVTPKKASTMTADQRLTAMRMLHRHRTIVKSAGARKIRELKAAFEADLANPVDKDDAKGNANRIKHMQELDAKIIDEKALLAAKVKKIDGAFEALLFPPEKPTTQADLFPVEPPKLTPEVSATLGEALAAVQTSIELRAAKAKADDEDDDEAQEDEAEHEATMADAAELQAILASMGARLGASASDTLDEQVAADPDAGALVVPIGGPRSTPKKGAKGNSRKRDTTH